MPLESMRKRPDANEVRNQIRDGLRESQEKGPIIEIETHNPKKIASAFNGTFLSAFAEALFDNPDMSFSEAAEIANTVCDAEEKSNKETGWTMWSVNRGEVLDAQTLRYISWRGKEYILRRTRDEHGEAKFIFEFPENSAVVDKLEVIKD